MDIYLFALSEYALFTLLNRISGLPPIPRLIADRTRSISGRPLGYPRHLAWTERHSSILRGFDLLQQASALAPLQQGDSDRNPSKGLQFNCSTSRHDDWVPEKSLRFDAQRMDAET